MSADSSDNYPYMPDTRQADARERQHYWAVAIGLQAVDGLQVSPYLQELADGYIAGTHTLAQTGELVRAKYHSSTASDEAADGSSQEADLVSQRIAELLEARTFALVPDLLAYIHRTLFQDLDDAAFKPGQFKTERLVKQEPILNGDSVLYADPSMLAVSLDYLFRNERARSYGALLDGDDLVSFVKFVSDVWQLHPFVEGNTRTTAVFSELYLDSLGFPAQNEPYQLHARYYRDALVRASYRNPKAGVAPDKSFLVRFYESVLGAADHPLDPEELVCTPLFENPTLLANIDPGLALVK